MILVTGYRGFIGSKLYERLKRDFGADEVVGIDVRDGHNLLTCELPQRIDVVYHLAAQSDVQASWKDPLHDLDNIRITARLAHTYPDARIIYANSCAAVDKSSPYGFSKWAAGEYLRYFHGNSVNCIFPNIFGAGSRSVVDIIKNNQLVTIYGDGKQTRDYVHVDDIVEALRLAYTWEPRLYFLGSGKSTSVNDLIGIGKSVVYAPARDEAYEVEVPNSTPDWKPTIDVHKYIEGV